jgi:hypothetical protein
VTINELICSLQEFVLQESKTTSDLKKNNNLPITITVDDGTKLYCMNKVKITKQNNFCDIELLVEIAKIGDAETK